MVGIIVATHGNFATGVLESAQMIVGEQENVAAVTLAPSEGPDDFRKKVEDAIATFSSQDEILLFVDLWGGTPFNQSSAVIKGHEEKWAIVTGLSLPMLVEAFGERFGDASAHEIATTVMATAKDAVKVLPEELAPKETAPQGEQVTHPTGEIPPGTVLGDGKIKLVLTRIDSRLLHGQVATSWTKDVNPDRIIVVSDGVAKDDLRKNMIIQAAPPGVKAHVVPVDKMIEVAKDPRFGATKAMLLFETPQDVLRVVEGGVDIQKINLGSMAHSKGKVVMTKAVAMGKDDVDTFDKLLAKGIKVDVRKVPTDAPENFDGIMKKAHAEVTE